MQPRHFFWSFHPCLGPDVPLTSLPPSLQSLGFQTTWRPAPQLCTLESAPPPQVSTPSFMPFLDGLLKKKKKTICDEEKGWFLEKKSFLPKRVRTFPYTN